MFLYPFHYILFTILLFSSLCTSALSVYSPVHSFLHSACFPYPPPSLPLSTPLLISHSFLPSPLLISFSLLPSPLLISFSFLPSRFSFPSPSSPPLFSPPLHLPYLLLFLSFLPSHLSMLPSLNPPDTVCVQDVKGRVCQTACLEAVLPEEECSTLLIMPSWLHHGRIKLYYTVKADHVTYTKSKIFTLSSICNIKHLHCNYVTLINSLSCYDFNPHNCNYL